LFFAKKPSVVEVLNDMHSDIVNLYRCLRDEDKAREIQRLMELTPYSREEFYNYRDAYKAEPDPVKRAYMWLYLAKATFGGKLCDASPAYGYTVTSSQATSAYLYTIDRLPLVHARLRTAQVEHDDALAVIKRYDTPDTFFYCDPPYAASMRSSGQYRHEVDDDHHRALVELLLSIQGKALLSCYYSDLYQPLIDAGWIRKDWQTCSMAAGRTRGSGIQGAGAAEAKVPRIETILANYPINDTQPMFDMTAGMHHGKPDKSRGIFRMDTGKLAGNRPRQSAM
jgi:DNA adenine methylase